MQICSLTVILLIGVPFMGGCAQHHSGSAQMTPLQERWADELIADWRPVLGNQLSLDDKTPSEIMEALKKKFPDLPFNNYYVHKGFVIVTIRFAPDEYPPGAYRDPNIDFANVALVNISTRQFTFVLLART